MTKLEKLDPSLTAAAAELGCIIRWNAARQAYVLFPGYLVLCGGANDRAVKAAHKALELVADARRQPKWGTPLDRALRVIEALRKAGLRWRHITEYEDWSGDRGSLARGYGKGQDYVAAVDLVGYERIGAAGASIDACFDALAAKCRNVLGEP